MQTLIAKFILLLMAVTLVVPESYAKRAGGGRSFGRQSQVTRQQRAPVPPVQRQQSAAAPQSAPAPAVQPGIARQAPPPAAPAQQIRRQASSPWGGLLGGALIGLGLGSLISGERNADAASQSVGDAGEGVTAAGSGDAQADTQANSAQAADGPQSNHLGWLSVLLLAALAAFVWVRRRRARTRGYPRQPH